MVTVIWDESDAAAEAKAARYRGGLDEERVVSRHAGKRYGVAGNAMRTARAQTAFMTQTAIGAPATGGGRSVANFTAFLRSGRAGKC